MSIQCGICKNIMPSTSFLNHKERKHSMIDHVPYVKLSNGDGVATDAAARATSAASVFEPMVKCRFCPNRVPKSAMERHLQRCHIECHLCGKNLLKSNRTKHMEQKHNIRDSNGISVSLPDLTVLSQSKSNSDVSITASNGNLAAELNSIATKMSFHSQTVSSSSSSSSFVSTLPSPSLSIPTIPDIKPSNLQQQHEQQQSPDVNEPNVLHVDIWQLSRYIRQGRVYNSNGWLYLRNSNNPM